MRHKLPVGREVIVGCKRGQTPAGIGSGYCFALGFLPSANRPIALACAEDLPVIGRILNQLASKDLPGL